MRKKCKVDGCTRLSDAKGFCNAHYLQDRAHGWITSVETLERNKGRICKVSQCDDPAYSKGYCLRHYGQVRKHGEIISEARMLGPRIGQMRHQGYIYILKPDHPHTIKHGYVKRANLVWEENTGHVVVPPEIIHRKNEIKTDDGFENQEMMENRIVHMRKYHGVERKEASCIR